MITRAEAEDLDQYLRSILDGKMRGKTPDRCRRAAAAAKASGRVDDDDLIQDTLIRLVESLDYKLPRSELRAYAKTTLHNVAANRARTGTRARRYIARFAEVNYGLVAPSPEREIELGELLERRLTSSEKQVAFMLMNGASGRDLAAAGYNKNDRAALRSKLIKLDPTLEKKIVR